ncbi:putative RNA-directed DNA polymerase [Helianthus debilis subsp. tardiflorus]
MEKRFLGEDKEWVYMENKKLLLEHEEKICADMKQRSRTRWALEGDESTSFFHANVNMRKVSNKIPGLNVGGRWIDDPAKVKREVMKFFRERFKEVAKERPGLVCSNLKRLNEPNKEILIEPFTVKEIKDAVNECGDDKAPGPDGLNMRFIKKFWGLFEVDFKNLMDEFFEKGNLSIGCGSPFITLVPKVKDPMDLKNYRPINLIGIISKVISKVLANQIKRVIGSVISESLSAFVKGLMVGANMNRVLNKSKVDGIPLRQFFKASVGNGQSTAFWLDPWVSNSPLKELFPNLFQLEKEKGCRVNRCISDNQHLSWRWKRPFVSVVEVNELVNLGSLLLQVDLNQNSDSWSWIGAADREYSTKAVKHLLDSERLCSEVYVPEVCRWIPKKCSIFIWKAEMGRLATVDELRKRNIGGGDPVCSLCGEADESIEHLFTNCCYASMLWAYISSWCKCQNIVVFSFRDLIEAHNHVRLDGQKKKS